jgi:plastocyanin
MTRPGTVRRGVVIVALAFAGFAVAVAGCGSSSSSSSGTTSESGGSGGGGGGQKTIAGVRANDHGTKTVAKETEVELDDYYFEPTVIQGKAGQKVTLELKNEGKVEHSFVIDSQKIDQTIQPGEDAKVTVTIPASGSVSFYCKFHKSEGMAGALAVKGQGTGGTMPGGGTTTNNTTTGKGYGY